MKRIFLSVLLLFGCTKSLPPEVVKAVPPQYDINDPMFSDAKEMLEAEVAQCGSGVVKGVTGENRCSYQIVIDSLFLRHPSTKTGFRYNPEWAYQDDVQFMLPPKRDSIPASFDLRDYMKNGQPLIKQQNCGDCWAWATHHGLEINRAVHDQLVVDASVQTVLSCSHEGSCGGGDMGAVDFLLHGLPFESAFPYTGRDTRCKFSAAEISAGWAPKMIATPYIGSSLDYSRALKGPDSLFSARPTVLQMQTAMLQWRSPLVVTVEAYSISGSGIYNSCSAINSGGNHMVTIVGWDNDGGHVNAHVWNSWGQSHGDHGVSRIKWECGAGKLNRGLGVSAKIVEYKPACEPPVPYIGKAKHTVILGSAVKIGKIQKDQVCHWEPAAGLSDPNSCETYASPEITTEYHLAATNSCGTASAMTLVEVWGPKGPGRTIITPSGPIGL